MFEIAPPTSINKPGIGRPYQDAALRVAKHAMMATTTANSQKTGVAFEPPGGDGRMAGKHTPAGRTFPFSRAAELGRAFQVCRGFACFRARRSVASVSESHSEVARADALPDTLV